MATQINRIDILRRTAAAMVGHPDFMDSDTQGRLGDLILKQREALRVSRIEHAAAEMLLTRAEAINAQLKEELRQEKEEAALRSEYNGKKLWAWRIAACALFAFIFLRVI